MEHIEIQGNVIPLAQQQIKPFLESLRSEMKIYFLRWDNLGFFRMDGEPQEL